MDDWRLNKSGLVGCELASQPRCHGFNSYPVSLSKVLPLAHEVPIHGLFGCNSSKLPNPKSRPGNSRRPHLRWEKPETKEGGGRLEIE